MLFLCNKKGRLCQVIVGTFFVFRNSGEKLCVSCVAFADKRAKVSICKTRISDTCVFVRTRLKSFLRETLEDWKDCKDYLTQTKPAKLSFSLSYNLINASRNIFLDALVAALNVSTISFIRAWKIRPSHPAVFHSHGNGRAVLRFLHTHIFV